MLLGLGDISTDLTAIGAKIGAFLSRGAPTCTGLFCMETPPASAPPGAPQTQQQMTTQSGTPGGYSTEQAIADSQAATLRRYQAFYDGILTDDAAGQPQWCDYVPLSGMVFPQCSSTSGLTAAAVVVGLVVLDKFVGKKRGRR